jgi:small subunit ribosomal protein S6
MKTYELGLILVPSLSEEEVRVLVSELTERVAGPETTAEKSETRGLQHLSYPIKHHAQGHRVFIDFKTEDGAALVESVQKALIHEERVLRHGITVKPKVMPARPKQTSVLTELRREKHATARAPRHAQPAAPYGGEPRPETGREVPQEKPDIQEIDKKIEELLQ